MNTPKFDISVVIVTYNNHRIITRCLATLSDVLADYSAQLCIIDNHSSDGTPDLLQQPNFWKQFSFDAVEELYNPANLGYTKGVNQGLRLAAGRYVLMLNPDIIFEANPFGELLEILRNDQNIGVVSPQFRFPDDTIQPSCRRFPTKRDVFFEFLGLSKLFSNSAYFNAWRMPDFTHTESCDVKQPQGAFLLTRCEVLEKIGVLDESFPMFFSDVDWCRRVIDHNWRIRFIASVYVYHIRGASVNQKRAHMIVSSHKSFVDYFRKYDKTWRDRCSTALAHFLLLMATPLRLLTQLHRL
jgi:GT2 family glycosyltransferase